MARKKTVTPGKFVKAYKKSNDVHELARRLNLSTPTCYAYIKKYDLKNLTRGVNNDVSDADIKKAIKKSKTLYEAAAKVGLAPTTFSQRCGKLGVSVTTRRHVNKEGGFKVIKQYYASEKPRIKNTALKLKIDERSVRHIIKRFANAFCEENEVPYINDVRDLIISCEIARDRSLAEDAETLADLTGLPLSRVENYIFE